MDLLSSGMRLQVTTAAMPFRHCLCRSASSRRTLLKPTLAMSGASDAEPSKFRDVAQYVADTFIADGQTVGLGTGLPINALIEEISQRLGSGQLKAIRCVPSSDVSASEAAFHGVPLATLEDASGRVDVVVDCANQVDASPGGGLAYIVGRGQNGPQAGQPSMPRLRALLDGAQQRVVLAEDEGTCTLRLGGDVPVEICGDESNWEETAEVLDDTFLGDAEIRRRAFKEGAGPRGGDAPVITADGHYVLDVQFYEGLKLFGEDVPYEAVAEEIEAVDGVVAHGLVVHPEGTPVTLVVAGKDGAVVVEKGYGLPFSIAADGES